MAANMLNTGVAWARAQLAEHASETVAYSRAGVGSVTLTDATIGQTPFRLEDNGKSRIEWGECDLIVPAASLILGGSAVEPRKNDRFTRTVNGASVTFEVSAPVGEQPWRYADQTRTTYRIHGKKVA